MLDTVLDFMNFANDQVFIQALPLRIMDNEGNIIVSVTFQEVLFTSFTELELNYTNNNPGYSSFSLGFKCNYIDIVLEAK
jgi:hypothetical protein